MSAQLKPIEDKTELANSVLDAWQADLALGFSFKNNKTVLANRHSFGPLAVQRPFYPEGDVCHVYVLHPPGGVVGGDRLNTEVTLDDKAHALITTPGAGKLYRSARRYSKQSNKLNIDDGTLEWFPQETIVFNGAHATINTTVNLTNNAKFIGWEIVCLGRPACEETFEQGEVKFNLELSRNDEPILLERLSIQGNDSLLTAAWGLRGYSCVATFIATNVNASLLETVKESITIQEHYVVGITMIENVLICRFLGNQAEDAKQCFIHIWSVIRLHITDKSICEPRIWKT